MSRVAGLFLLVAGLSACGYRPETPLEAAASSGNVAEIERLIAGGARADQLNSHGARPLTAAARAGRVEAIKALIAHGAPIDLPEGGNGWTPLMHAVHKAQNGSVAALLDAGCSAKAQNSKALTMAAGYGNAAAVRLLLAHGADPRDALPDGSTALVAAVGSAWDIDYRWPGCGPHTEVVQVLLQSVPELALPDNEAGRSAYAFAQRKQCKEMLSLVHAPQS